MLILSIETSCDETAISLVTAEGEFPNATYEILGDGLWSQAEAHAEYGGVFPALAKREHARTLPIMLLQAGTESGLLENHPTDLSESDITKLHELLEREEGLADSLIHFFAEHSLPKIDLITVTSGPGLEPALWVGLSFAKALAFITDTNVVPTNHMEGHILASIYDVERDDMLSDIDFPTIALLISGGHTELVEMSDWGKYNKIGQTRDDAVGEAFDKVARLIGLPYPGGPAISKLAAVARKAELPEFAPLPRPMLHSGDLDFSFSGLKTAVRYAVADKELTDDERASVARDFENAVTETLLKKASTAVADTGAKTLIVGGGVSANGFIKRAFESHFLTEFPDCTVYFPSPSLATDNSIMIALAGHARATSALSPGGSTAIQADGNKSL
ncbi:MAG: N6-L-threonylcarbamoyladenine synthase [Candidatus Paceibacteria bacterium]|jgi:N6-L-threonylcarbamoyladenine synthase